MASGDPVQRGRNKVITNIVIIINAILHKFASAGLAMYSGIHQIILPTPSTRSTRGQRDGQDPVTPLARDRETSSAKISNS